MTGDPPYRVVVIGAGFAGIGMGVALRQAGISDFLIVDKAGGIGGTWRDNTYPGLCCDVPCNLYSYSVMPEHMPVPGAATGAGAGAGVGSG